MASRRRRRNAQQIPKNVKVLISTLASALLAAFLVMVILTTIGGAALNSWKVGALFLGMVANVGIFVYNFKQIKAPGFDTKITLACTLISLLSLLGYLFVYVIGLIS